MRDVESLYYKLFSIPKPHVMFTISLSVALLSSIIQRQAILVWLSSIAAATIAVKFLKLKFDAKRVAFFALLITLLSLPSLLIFHTPIGSFFFFLAVMYFCSEAGLLRAAALSTATYLALDPSIATLIVALVSSALFFAYLRVLNVNIGKVNIRSFVESFVLFWLTSNASYMEKYLAATAENFVGRVRCLSFGNAKLISTDFHPGPFRNVGGAKLVKVLDGIYLHSPTSHARNPVSSEDVKKIASAVSCGSIKLKPLKPFKLSGKKFDVYCFPFDKVRLIMVSGKEAIDDFSISCDHFVVDCHNAHKAGWDVSEEEMSEIRELISRAAKVESSEANLRYALVKLQVETESICNYVAALLLDYGGERYAIVVFDSNNVKREFRRYVEEQFAQLGYSAIVASTDNHEKTGVRAKESYKAAGECSEDWKIVDKLVELCKKAELRSAKCSYAESKVRVRVMGERFLHDSRLALLQSAKFIAIFLVLAIVPFMLAALQG